MIHFFHLPLKCYNATISMYAALADLLFSLTVCPNALPLPASTPYYAHQSSYSLVHWMWA